MTDKETAEAIVAEAKRWTETQFTLQAGIPGVDSMSRNEAKARIELLQHIETTFIEKRENAQL